MSVRSKSANGGAIRSRLAKYLQGGEGSEVVAPAPPVPIRDIFRHFWPYAQPYRRYITLSVVLMAATPLLQGARLYMVKITVDEVLLKANLRPMLWIAPITIGLTLLVGALSFFNAYLSSWIGERFMANLRGHFFDHLQGLSLPFFQQRRLGDVLARLLGDTGVIGTFVISGVATALSAIFAIFVFGVGMFLIDWRLALIFSLTAPVFVTTVRMLSRLTKGAARERSRRGGAMMAYAEESFSNIALVQANNQQDRESAKFRTESMAALRAGVIVTRLRAIFSPTTDLVQAIAGLGIITVGTVGIKDGRLTLGVLLLFVAYTQQLYGPMRGLARLYQTTYAASAGAERVIEFLDEQPEVVDRPRAENLQKPHGAVEFDDVSFTYPGSAQPALRNITISLEPGQKVALVGHSGAGKSTLARLVLRFHDPSSGVVKIDGKDLRDLTVTSVRDSSALLLQDTLMFDGSVRENILYGNPSASEDELIEAARAADAHDFITRFSDGYDTGVGQRGSRLSGGQRQRVAIARAMIRSAPILILDEPTTGLDADSSHKVLHPLRRLMAGRTTLMISHNLMTVRDADVILLLEDGRIAETGSHDELIERNGLYAHFVRLQTESREDVSAAGTRVS